MDVPGAEQEHLQCPVCYEIPLAEIFQCRDGHVICRTCYGRVTSCPQCRQDFEPHRPIRCRYMEILVDRETRNVTCPNQEFGCTYLFRSHEIDKHLENCAFSNSVNLCSMLGYNCDYKFKMSKLGTGVRHLTLRHGFLTVHKNESIINLREWDKVSAPSVDISWTPIIFKLRKAGGSYAIVYCTTTKSSQMLSAACILLESGESSANDIEANLDVFRTSTRIEDMYWKVGPVAKLTRQITGMSEFSVMNIDLRRIGHFVWNNMLTLVVHLGPVGNSLPRDVVGANVELFPVRKQSDFLENFKCTVCEDYVSGVVPVKYKCLQCPQITICQKCMSDKRHPDHLFAMVVNRRQERHLVSLQESQPTWLGILRPKSRRVSTSSSDFVSAYLCDECEIDPIRGILYKCLYCPEFELCHNCVNKGVHSSHLFAVIYTKNQERAIQSLQSERDWREVISPPNDVQ